MSEIVLEDEVVQLAERDAHGLKVELLYKKLAKQVLVRLVEHGEDQEVEFPVPPESANDAFEHPYAYYQEYLGNVALQAA